MDPLVVLVVVFLFTIAIGVPIVWSMGLACISSCLVSGGIPMAYFIQKMEAGGEKYAFLAIFFFMFAGAIMQHGGISKRLVEWCRSLLGHIRGGLAIVVIVACTLFAALSGSSIATTAAIGGMLYPELLKEGYPDDFAAALPIAGGTLGIVIPPSITFVIYGTAMNTSVSKLLLSGVIPGALAGVIMAVYAYYYSCRHNLPISGTFSLKRAFTATRKAFFAIMMPVIVLGGIYAGYFTPTESAAISVLYGLIVSFFYNELSWKRLLNIILDSAKGTANIMMLVMVAGLFGYVLTINNVPRMVTSLLEIFVTNKITFLLLLNVMLAFLGMLMDAGAIILIVGPLVYPMAMSFGIDPVQLGCIMVFNLAVGQATPPFGNCLFAAMSVTHKDIISLSKAMLPFFVLLFGTVLLTSFIPGLSMLLPTLAL